MAPTCNEFIELCTDIQLIWYWVSAYLQHQIQQGIIGVQIAPLNSSNLT